MFLTMETLVNMDSLGKDLSRYPLHKGIKVALRWYLSVGAKLFRVVPKDTSAVVFATLASQFFLLVAFFLPLKVLILIGRPDIPAYFPQAWQTVERDNLIITLTAGTAGFYLLHLLAEKIIVLFSKKGANRLLEKSKKIGIFKNQNDIAIRAYHRYSRSLASLVFAGLSFSFIGVLYFRLVLVILAYVAIVFVLISLVFTFINKLRAKLSADTAALAKVLGAVGFLLVFTFMVADFITNRPPNRITAIICLLLVRQLMLRLAGFVVDIDALFSKRLHIDVLFFHGKKFAAELSQRDYNFWSLLEMPYRDEWVTSVLREVVALSPQNVECVWHKVGIKNVDAFEVSAYGDAGQTLGHYLFKLFNDNCRVLAQNEAILLSECAPSDLGSLRLLGVDQVESYYCHVFEWTKTKELSSAEFKIKRQEIATRLLLYPPPKKLLKRYSRSRPLLGQRLNCEIIALLRLVTSNSKQLEQLAVLEKNLPLIQDRLRSLPTQIVNLDMRSCQLKCSESSDALLIHWGRWSIEPVGAGWPVPNRPVADKHLNQLAAVVAQAKKEREDLIPVIDTDIKLAALMFFFEHAFKYRKYDQALETVASIIVCLENGDAGQELDGWGNGAN